MTEHGTQNVTNLKNLKCDKTQKLKTWLNSKTQNVKKKTQKLKMWQNSKNEYVKKIYIYLNGTKI